MVGLKNPCNKCLVSAMCKKKCPEYEKFDRLFDLLFSPENLSVTFTLLTLLPASILIMTGFFKPAIVMIMFIFYFVVGFILATLAKSAAKASHEDHLYKLHNYIVLLLVGVPVAIAVLISNRLEKYRRCAAYK